MSSELDPAEHAAGLLAISTTFGVLFLLFESAAQTFNASNTAYVFAHWLGARPVIFQAYLRCVIAQLDYSIGDEVLLSSHSTDAACVTVSSDVTNIIVASAGTPSIAGKLGNGYTAITLAPTPRWEVFVRAWY
jgi:hypothetical protein